MNLRKNNSGFTLVEMIIYVSVIGLIMTAFAYYVLGLSGLNQKNLAVGEVQANTRLIFSAIESRIRSAEQINTSTSVFDIENGVLSLKMTELGKNPTVIKISQTDRSLLIIEGVNTTTVTSDSVLIDRLVFTDFSSNTIRGNVGVDLQVKYRRSGSREFEYSQDIFALFDLRP